MHWQYALYLLAPFLIAAISAGLALYAWRHRRVPGAPAFTVLMLAVTTWAVVTSWLGTVLYLWGVSLVPGQALLPASFKRFNAAGHPSTSPSARSHDPTSATL